MLDQSVIDDVRAELKAPEQKNGKESYRQWCKADIEPNPLRLAPGR